ncbi:MAG: 2-isopropylmalate synthase [Endomicrobiia bacterium]|nr:2-isopropylmalate synthase [Endomicrobiia bacterium]
MIKYNPNRKTLEQDEYIYELQDVESPNLYDDVFPYTEIPKIAFNHRMVPMIPPEDIWVTDTTFRDGQQSRAPFSVEQIVKLYKLLSRLGGPNGVIRQTEFFVYTPRDREAIEKCRDLGLKFPEITAWMRARKEDFKLVKEMRLKETGILTSCSDYHIFLKLKKTRRQALDGYLEIVRAALDEGIVPRCHFEDITRADFYGFVIPFAIELMKLSKRYKLPVKIRACDTLGLAVAYPGASLPRNVNGIIYGLTRLAGVPGEWLEWHGHNDFYRALANSTFAWLYGASGANGALLGIGERTGNTPVEALCVEYAALRGDTNGMDLSAITEISEFFSKELGHTVPANQPFVGSHFNVTKAGIHADGIMKDEKIYNIFDTNRLLNRPADVAITDKSGAAGIAFWLNSRLKLPEEQKLGKENPAVVKIKDWVDEQFAAGRVTDIAEQEMWALSRQFLPEMVKNHKYD